MGEISNRDTLIWLNNINIGAVTIDLLMNSFNNISDIWKVPKESIYNLKGIRTKTKRRIISYRNHSYLENILSNIDKTNVNVVTIFDNIYPKSLRYIYGSPKVLYFKGEFSLNDYIGVAIVGSRKATSYGMWASEKIARELSKLDITVVSGMAKGIDTAAHKGALKENGRTIAVLGSGLDVIYPARNIELYHSICNNGIVMSEFPMGTKPLPYNFPQRNRIISGLSLGVVVVEAEERSGSLITAELAADQGKEVFAVPGNINSLLSKGTNKLIKDGAKLVMDIDDIIEEINELKEKLIKTRKNNINFSILSETEKKILKSIDSCPLHCDTIVYKTGLDISTVFRTLKILEIKGIVKEISSNVFSIV